MSIVKNREKIKYYIGVDVGTNSVGWAVIDENGYLLNKGKHHLWGSRLFDQAQTAQNRRNYRSSRRRYNKRRERIRLLQMIMSDMVLKVDSSFFIRLEKTTFLDKEDKKAILKDNYKMNYNLFCDEDYNDKDYFKNYPTIYHLRKKLCESDEKAEPRLIYLALHHIVKYRGNFLYEGQELHLESSNKEDDLKICAKIVYNKEIMEQLYPNKNKQEYHNIIWQDIRNNINKQMPAYKYIREIIVTDEPLIKTTTQKVKRNAEMEKILSI